MDTYIDEYYSNGVSLGDSTSSYIDADYGGYVTQGLLRFDHLFGDQAGQIASDTLINSAVLELDVSNGGDSLLVHEMLQSWTDAASWSSFTNGVQANDIDSASASVASTGSISTGTLQIDVTSSLQAWQTNPDNNQGWAFLPTGNNGVRFGAAEGSNAPRLVVDISQDTAIKTTPEGGSDSLIGGSGNDTLYGDEGKDILNGTDENSRGILEQDSLT
ncbi:MAG: DNRLRE domain-containing protein [Cyanobacteria bacterium J06626_14]